jgi:uncharacterized protein (UPF0332 family)
MAALRCLAPGCDGCVNRLYYACFYAVSGLLLQDGLSASKHTGVRSLFNRHYVRTGKVPKELAPIYNDLFERRQEGDYMDFVDFEEAAAHHVTGRPRTATCPISQSC